LADDTLNWAIFWSTQQKFDLYEEAGVQEYWIVEPEEKLVLIYNLENGRYIGKSLSVRA